jgi:hypothetical protein
MATVKTGPVEALLRKHKVPPSQIRGLIRQMRSEEITTDAQLQQNMNRLLAPYVKDPSIETRGIRLH